ncbi:MAG: hypothetical protein F6K19_42125 [Cyanothece sp. SIO1E1]|nr:hypothetical protein [Cyanothece sp. SIO1E1]
MKKTIQRIALLGSLLVVFLELQAQSSFFTNEKYAKNGLSIQLGWQWNQTQDLVFSPLIYSGSSLTNIALQYQRFQPKGLHQVSIGYGQSDITAADLITFTDFGPSFSRIPSETRQLHLHYGYAHLIKNADAFQWFLGGLVESQIHHTTYNFGLSDDDGYLLTNDLQAWLMAFWQWNGKNRIGIDISFPLVAYVSRPKYAIVDNEEIQHDGPGLALLYQEGEWASLKSYQALDLNLTLDHRISNAAAIQFGYGLEYHRYSNPLSISILQNKFNLGLALSF